MKSFALMTLMLLHTNIYPQREWKVFNTSNSPLISNNILLVKAFDSSNVWIGTEAGLYKYDGIFWKYYNIANSPIPYNFINSLTMSQNGNLWFAVSRLSNPYFKMFNGEDWMTVDSNQNCFSRISNFSVDSFETKWVHDSNMYKIIRYDESGCIIYGQTEIGINTNLVTRTKVDDNNNFWFISQQQGSEPAGVARTTETGWVYYFWHTLVDLAVDVNNNCAWVSSPFQSSLIKLNYNNLQATNSYSYPNLGPSGFRYGLSLNNDFNGNIWQAFKVTGAVDTYIGLLCLKVSTEDWELYNQSNSPLPSNIINSISSDLNNNKWIATNEGLAVYNEENIVLPAQLTKEDTLNFGDVAIDSSSFKWLTICNNTNNTIVIDSININSNLFFTHGNLPLVIPVSDSSDITIEFHTDSIGNFSSKLILYTNMGMYINILNGKGMTALSVYNEFFQPDFSLSQNYPNPFNPSTKISWQSPVGSHQTLKVYDVLGREVVTLVNEFRDAGSHEVEFDAKNLSSGVYYYQLKVGDPLTGSGRGFVKIKKMILVK